MVWIGQHLLFASLFLTLLAGVAALGGRSLLFHRLSQGLLVASGVFGMVASLHVLLAPTHVERFSIAGADFLPTFQLDLFGAIFFFLLSFASILCAIYAVTYLASYRKVYHVRSVNALVAAFVLGMQIVLLAQGTLAFMVGWEVMSMASFFLVTSDRSRESIRAALLYLAMTQVGAAALLSGFLLLAQGSLFADFSSLASLAWGAPAWVVSVCFALFLFGFGSKAGLVPLHVWLPEAHPAAPSHISALMSGVMLKIAIYGFLRLTLFILPPLGVTASLFILGFGLLSALYGVLYAVVERDLKRTLAFSSIENIGLIFTMIGVAFFAGSMGLEGLSQTALVAAIFFTIAHALFKSGLFLASGVIVRAVHTRHLEKMGGLAKRMPLFSFLFGVLCLAAASLPPFGPFFGEWLFLQGLFQNFTAQSLLVKGVLVGTFSATALVGGLAIFAMVKLFALSMLAEPRSHEAQEIHARPSVWELLPIALFALLILAVGLYAPHVLALLGAGPLFVASPTAISVGSATIQPVWISLLLAGCVLVVWGLRRIMSRTTHERAFGSWDCGQPIDASMEYTATAFSAPIRFFFRAMLRTRKTLVAHPVVLTNPWVATHRLTIDLRSIWMDYGYTPLGRLLIGIAERVKKIQSGNIRLYLLLLFLTLILTLWIGL